MLNDGWPFFGLPANTTLTFANTSIYIRPDGTVTEADLTNMAQVPEPASMALFVVGRLGFAAVTRRRRAQ